MPISNGVKKKTTGGVEIDASVETAVVKDGGLKIGESADATKAVISWDETAKKYKYHDGTDWVYFGGSGGLGYVFGDLDPVNATYPQGMDTEAGDIFANYEEAP